MEIFYMGKMMSTENIQKTIVLILSMFDIDASFDVICSRNDPLFNWLYCIIYNCKVYNSL